MNIEFGKDGFQKALSEETNELLKIYDISDYMFVSEGPQKFENINGTIYDKLTCYLAFYDKALQVDFILGNTKSFNVLPYYYLSSIHYTYLDQVEISADYTGSITNVGSFAQSYTLFGASGTIVVYGDDSLQYLDKTLSELKTFLDITRN